MHVLVLVKSLAVETHALQNITCTKIKFVLSLILVVDGDSDLVRAVHVYKEYYRGTPYSGHPEIRHLHKWDTFGYPKHPICRQPLKSERLTNKHAPLPSVSGLEGFQRGIPSSPGVS